MFKLTHGELMKQDFGMALQQLGELKLPVKTAWNITRMLRQIGKKFEEAGEPYTNVLKEHCELSEDGNLKPQENPEVKDKDGKVVKEATPVPNTYVVKEGKKEALEKELKEFMDIAVEIESFKIKIDELKDKQGQPLDLSANLLGSLIYVLED